MKKLILFVAAVLAFSFNLNQKYSCETLGFSFQGQKGLVSVPNNFETNKKIKESLGKLYIIEITPKKGALDVTVGDKKDTLKFVKNLKKDVKMYKTSDSALFLITDDNATQAMINIPQRNMQIYYQCK